MNALDPRQERDRLAGGTLARMAIAVLLVLSAAIATSILLLRARGHAALSRHEHPFGAPSPVEIGFVEQRLIASTKCGLDQNEAQRQELERYGWVDRAQGLAHIPIARAIDLTIADLTSGDRASSDLTPVDPTHVDLTPKDRKPAAERNP